MKLTAHDFAGRARAPEWERELAKKLRSLSETERFRFLDDFLSVHPVVALDLARKCLSEKSSFENLLERGLREADSSSIREWLECVMPHLGLRRVVRSLLRLLSQYPKGVENARYWLPMFLKGSGCSEADLRTLLVA